MEETTNTQQAPDAFVDTRPSWDEYFMKLAEEVANTLEKEDF
jgi:deoxycytidylate deaminase